MIWYMRNIIQCFIESKVEIVINTSIRFSAMNMLVQNTRDRWQNTPCQFSVWKLSFSLAIRLFYQIFSGYLSRCVRRRIRIPSLECKSRVIFFGLRRTSFLLTYGFLAGNRKVRGDYKSIGVKDSIVWKASIKLKRKTERVVEKFQN